MDRVSCEKNLLVDSGAEPGCFVVSEHTLKSPGPNLIPALPIIRFVGDMKRSRARVTIEGQPVLLQISLQIKNV